MMRIARGVFLVLLSATALGTSGCAHPRAHPWRPPPFFTPKIHTWTGTYWEFPPSINKPHVVGQGRPSDG